MAPGSSPGVGGELLREDAWGGRGPGMPWALRLWLEGGRGVVEGRLSGLTAEPRQCWLLARHRHFLFSWRAASFSQRFFFSRACRKPRRPAAPFPGAERGKAFVFLWRGGMPLQTGAFAITSVMQFSESSLGCRRDALTAAPRRQQRANATPGPDPQPLPYSRHLALWESPRNPRRPHENLRGLGAGPAGFQRRRLGAQRRP